MDKTLLKGLTVIEALAKSSGPRGVSDLARSLALSKTSTHRLLQTLASAGYIAKDNRSDAYQLTTKTWEIGTAAVSRLDVRKISSTHLQKLANQSRESVHITILDRGEVIYIDKIDSPEPLRTFSAMGGRAPAYCVATGKAMLAYQSEDAIVEVSSEMKTFTKKTIRSTTALTKELAHTRSRGYAVNNCEWRENICSVGAPIFNAYGNVVAALGIAGPKYRIGKSLDKLGRLVRTTAEEISRELGYSGPGAALSI